jgi:type I restriction enzyme R subunit
MDFLEKLQEMIEQAEKLVLDWRKRQQSRAAVKLAIEEELDRLPEAFTARLYEQKCASIYQHVYDSYFGRGKSIYAATVRARLAPGPRD